MDARGLLTQNPLPGVAKTKTATRDFSRSPTRKTKSPLNRLISIIIPAHNEERYLGGTLEALRHQNYSCFEIIVVANGCTDRTAEVARGRCERLIVLSQKGLGVSRNLGARMARGEILVFLDADTTLEPMALRVIAEDFAKGDGAATLKGRPDSEQFRYRMIYAYKNFTHRHSLHCGSSGVIICWRKDFIRCGGFDEGLEISENSELIGRLKGFGKYKYIGGVAATTSMRRFARRGFGRMAWTWLKFWLQSHFGDLHQRPYETVR
jgi:glycosyltransferase involved in cell wall biosynthesis